LLGDKHHGHWGHIERFNLAMTDGDFVVIQIDARQLNVRMPTADSSTELVELAQGLNLMLERLEQNFERISEFSSDLAHELRTPITNLLTQTQVTLTRDRDAESYRDILASNAEEFQRLARMVSDMLYLAKTEHGLELPNREPLSGKRGAGSV